jgi:prophage regulatory protein
MNTQSSRPTTKESDDAGSADLHILRFPDVVKKTGLSKSSIYQRIRAKDFPTPIHIGPRAVGFVRHEVDEFICDLMEHARVQITATPSVAVAH